MAVLSAQLDPVLFSAAGRRTSRPARAEVLAELVALDATHAAVQPTLRTLLRLDITGGGRISLLHRQIWCRGSM